MKKYLIVSLLVVFLFAGNVYAASTIGTNMSTTGTFTITPATNSATSVRFQSTAGTNYLIGDSTNLRIGINGTPTTTLEVQGTASASYLLTANSLQVFSALSTVAYSRFGTGTTGRSLAAADDILVSGLIEFDDNAFFDNKVSVNKGTPSTQLDVAGTSSASYGFFSNSLQVFGSTGASVAYSRFGTGTTGHSLAAADDVLFTGLVEFNDNAFLDAKASVSGNFQTSGRFIADTAASHSITGDLLLTDALVVGSTTASNSGATYVAEFGGGSGTASVSILFGSSTASSKGTCLQLKDSTGAWVYARVANGGSTFTINTIKCH
jgi:O-acetyl-ADP-ribose deacetylase (regulator of RNase III)